MAVAVQIFRAFVRGANPVRCEFAGSDRGLLNCPLSFEHASTMYEELVDQHFVTSPVEKMGRGPINIGIAQTASGMSS
jgi:hypothetical protein